MLNTNYPSLVKHSSGATICWFVLLFLSVLPASTLHAQVTDTLYNIDLVMDTPALYNAPGGGYVSGHNSFGDRAKVDVFNPGTSGSVYGALLFFGIAKYANASSKVTVAVWDHNTSTNSPGVMLASEQLLISSINTSGYTSVTFDTPAYYNNTFYLGVSYNYVQDDTVALITNSIGTSQPSTAWEQWMDGTWYTYNDTLGGWGISLSHYIFALVDQGLGVTISGADTICPGAPLTLTANVSNATGAVSYLWSPGGQTSQSINVSPTGTTAYTVTIVDGSTTRTASATVNVLSLPAIYFTATVSGNTVNITSTTSNASSALWNFGDGQTSTSINPVQYTYPSNGTYTISGIVHNVCGSDTFSRQVTITQGNTACNAPTPNICIVGLDSASGKNMIVWNKASTTTIAGYIIAYGLGTGMYQVIDTQLYSEFSTYIDMGSVPQQQSYTYALAAIDTCGLRTPFGTEHTTMHVSVNQGVGNTWNLIWNHYVGFTITGYSIYRGNSSTNLTLLATIPANLTSYTDLNPPAGNVYYQLEVRNPNGCNPTAKDYGVLRSNIASSPISGLHELQYEPLKVYPNPFSTSVTIEMPASGGTFDLSVLDITGKEVAFMHNITAPAVTLERSTLPEGVFYAQLRGKHNIYRCKLVAY